MVRSADGKNAREAIRGGSHPCYRDAAAVKQVDTRAPQLLNQAGAADGDARLRSDVNPILARGVRRQGGGAAAAARLRVREPSDTEAVQVQRYTRRTDRDARQTADRARHVTDEPAVIRDRQRRSNGPADIGGAGAPGTE